MRKKFKIFVSNRIDLDSVAIPNSLYIPVRCGAVYDKRKNVKMLGDDTGDNISEKRESFCEFTVMYWAWKNQQADYYGLCHYRRYLSFADKYFDCKVPQRYSISEVLDKKEQKKYSLLNKSKIKREISKYDIITSVTYPVSNLNWSPRPRNEREVWTNHPDIMIFEPDIDLLISVVDELFPVYSETINEEINGTSHRGYNCFIMKKELFNQMCEFIFGVLFEVEKRIDYSHYAGKSLRVFGYMGEILYNTFIRWAISQGNLKVKETQIILFKRTTKNEVSAYRKHEKRENFKNVLKKVLPSYRVSVRIEKELHNTKAQVNSLKTAVSNSQKQLLFMRNVMMMQFWFSEPKYPDRLNDIKQNFWSSYPSATGELLLIQKSNTILLKELKRICDKLNVKFWFHGGSLVGAVRHNNCVPWDDDIDVAMMRSDAKTLMEYLSNDSKYAIKEYYYCGLGCRSYRFTRRDIDVPFFVDIFLYDNYSLTTDSPMNDWFKIRDYKGRGLCAQYKQIALKYGPLFNNITLDDKLELKSELDSLIDSYIYKFKYNNSSDYILWGLDNNYENSTRFAWHHGRIFSKNDIFPLQEVVYDNEIYYMPINYKKYIYAEYGINYLDMPTNIGQAVHFNEYFSNKDIYKLYAIMEESFERNEEQV